MNQNPTDDATTTNVQRHVSTGSVESGPYPYAYAEFAARVDETVQCEEDLIYFPRNLYDFSTETFSPQYLYEERKRKEQNRIGPYLLN